MAPAVPVLLAVWPVHAEPIGFDRLVLDAAPGSIIAAAERGLTEGASGPTGIEAAQEPRPSRSEALAGPAGGGAPAPLPRLVAAPHPRVYAEVSGIRWLDARRPTCQPKP